MFSLSLKGQCPDYKVSLGKFFGSFDWFMHWSYRQLIIFNFRVHVYFMSVNDDFRLCPEFIYVNVTFLTMITIYWLKEFLREKVLPIMYWWFYLGRVSLEISLDLPGRFSYLLSVEKWWLIRNKGFVSSKVINGCVEK